MYFVLIIVKPIIIVLYVIGKISCHSIFPVMFKYIYVFKSNIYKWWTFLWKRRFNVVWHNFKRNREKIIFVTKNLNFKKHTFTVFIFLNLSILFKILAYFFQKSFLFLSLTDSCSALLKTSILNIAVFMVIIKYN